MEIQTYASIVVPLAAVVATIIVALVIWTSNKKIYEMQRKQHESYLAEQKLQTVIADHQKKLDSANLVRKLNKGLRSPEFRDLGKRIFTKDLDLANQDEQMWLLRYINYVSPICKLHHDGLILESDMAHEFGPVMTLLDMNNSIREYIERHEDNYPYLVWYMDVNRKRRAHKEEGAHSS